MIYPHLIQATFLERPNRFIAKVDLQGKIETVHVKNTGRCKEILRYGTTVFLEAGKHKNRKTAYDLVGAYKDDLFISIDSQLPNKLFLQWVEEGNFLPNITKIQREYSYETSRLDFYLETKDKQILVEVKGVTLENKGVVSFPDAPTLRGAKHIHTLIKGIEEGYTSYLVFVVQLSGGKVFYPNEKTDANFALALKEGIDKGVIPLVLGCMATPKEIKIIEEIPFMLSFPQEENGIEKVKPLG